MSDFQARYNKNYVEKTIKETIADLHLDQFATKQDIARLEKEMEKFATKEDLNNLKTDLKHEIRLEINAVKADINETNLKLYQIKSELLRWQIGIAVVIMSANFALLKLMLH
jgi:hypothetical protein